MQCSSEPKGAISESELEALVPFVAGAVDLLGEPPAAWHPVVWYGKLIRRLEQSAPAHGRAMQFIYGGMMLVLATPLVLLPALLADLLIRRMSTLCSRHGYRSAGRLFYVLLEGCALKPFFAIRMLAHAGRAVRLALERGDLVAARQELRSLVSRERAQLTVELAAAAAVESLAENLCDSVVAPLFYYSLFGLPGAALYRLYNTFDSMLGYHGHYEYLGKAAARLDDVLNLLPARITALLILICAPLLGGEWRTAWRIWRRDARKTASPNAGHPMAAAAGVLGVQLEKVGHYRLGDNAREISTTDIKRAERMVWLIGGISLVLAALSRLLLRRTRHE